MKATGTNATATAVVGAGRSDFCVASTAACIGRRPSPRRRVDVLQPTIASSMPIRRRGSRQHLIELSVTPGTDQPAVAMIDVVGDSGELASASSRGNQHHGRSRIDPTTRCSSTLRSSLILGESRRANLVTLGASGVTHEPLLTARRPGRYCSGWRRRSASPQSAVEVRRC